MKKAILILVIFSFCISCKKDSTTEPDNEKILTVTIGSQVWMSKNLDVVRYRNGDLIPEVKDPDQWSNMTTGAFCFYNNDPSTGYIYGKLYNWYAVNDPRGLAPLGWHIPTNYEWSRLTTVLGGINVAGGKLKDNSTNYWNSPNTGASNESGFSALPGGHRDLIGRFSELGDRGYWWTSSEFNYYSAMAFILYYDGADSFKYAFDNVYGFSNLIFPIISFG